MMNRSRAMPQITKILVVEGGRDHSRRFSGEIYW
jgi:hypothetical protein